MARIIMVAAIIISLLAMVFIAPNIIEQWTTKMEEFSVTNSTSDLDNFHNSMNSLVAVFPMVIVVAVVIAIGNIAFSMMKPPEKYSEPSTRPSIQYEEETEEDLEEGQFICEYCGQINTGVDRCTYCGAPRRKP